MQLLNSMIDISSQNKYIAVNNLSSSRADNKIPLISRVNLRLNKNKIEIVEGKHQNKKKWRCKNRGRHLLHEIIKSPLLKKNRVPSAKLVRPQSSLVLGQKKLLPTSLLQFKEINNNDHPNYMLSRRPIFRTKIKATAGGYPVTKNANRIGITGLLSSPSLSNNVNKYTFNNSCSSVLDDSDNNHNIYEHCSKYQFQQQPRYGKDGNCKPSILRQQQHLSNWGGGYPFDTNNFTSKEYML